MRFDEQVAIVTGAGSGLGRAYGIALAERGARVVLIDSGIADSGCQTYSGAGLNKTAKTLAGLGADCLTFQLDVRNPQALKEAVDTVMTRWGRIDILINNAGVHSTVPFDTLSFEQWQQQLDVDLNGSFHLTKLVWPLMKQQNYGRIVMTGSASGLYGDMHETHFSASKMALVGLVNSLAKEGREYNIYVNTLVPQALTPMTEHHLSPLVKPLFSTSSVNAALLYLCSAKACTGQHLLVAAGSVSHGMFVECQPLRIIEDGCKPEEIAHRWDELYRAQPYLYHESGEEQVTAWAKRSAAEHNVDIE
ncbi:MULTISPECIES: SDR family NAD(P)-dependent oxidoreductase [Shewanella]|uniref:SDR family NAD(P)-dependent oxidoreductase n=1 Tax=Shewanella marisflavi TaxID=260364 RepID=A0AAC9TYJ2_9GAMM|nr:MULTISPECIES: SDR family NAD(P)-dependent oxidoreductase [Shewanella]ASJ96268.1 short-chain dehydrogenase [Shewanella marisflavi]MCL1042115.1 SDR family NAD(P)-dependent oxidoreductase [Shewanella marisflavi]QDF74795.1 SDR family NAD(P)-dependent oxidoreductase [Shewanella marisflavi]